MKHLKEKNETYLRHLRTSMYYAGCMLVGSLCAVTHALVPCVLTKTTTNIINHVKNKIEAK